MPHLDPAESFEALKEGVKQAVSDTFPFVGSKHTLRLKGIEIVDDKGIDDVADQKQAKLNNRTFGIDVKANIELVDNQTGKVISAQTRKIATLPKITNRYSYIVDGSEYQVDSLWKLKPGIYTRIKQNGQLESQINVKGGGFHIGFDPATRKFTMRQGGANPALYPIMKAAGLDDETLQRAWGKEILEANRTKDLTTTKTAVAVANRLNPFQKSTNFDDASKAIQEAIGSYAIRPEVSSRTLGKPFETVSPEALLKTTERLLGVARGKEAPDDRDAIMYKQLDSTEDFIANRIVESKRLIERRVKNNLDRKDKVGDIVSPDLFNRPIRTFFTKSSLSSTSEQTNPLSMLSAHQKTTIMGDEGGIKSAHRIIEEAKLVNPSHFGVLDPIHTPEGERTGVTLHVTLGARKDRTGVTLPLYNIKTRKLERVDPGTVFDSIVVMPDQVEWKEGKPVPKSKTVHASLQGNDIGSVDYSKAQYILPSVGQVFTLATNMVPFLNNNSQNRATMSGRHQEQAISLKNREVPLVQSVASPILTYDEILGHYASQRARFDGTVESVHKDRIVIKDKAGAKHTVQLYDNYPLNEKKGVINSTPVVKDGDVVKKGQLLADTSFTKDGVYAPGVNLKVAYLPMKGLNTEDAVVISDSAAKKLMSEHLYKKRLSTQEGQLLGVNKYLAYYPTKITKEQQAKLDADGVIKPGLTVAPGDTLLAALAKVEVPPEEASLAKIHKSLVKDYADRAVTWDEDYPGTIQSVHKHGKGVTVFVKTEEPAVVGDKIVSRHANKGLVSAVVPDHEMPHTKDGSPVEVIHNPLGVPGRMNLGQILETAATKVARKTGQPVKIKNFTLPDATAHVSDLLKQHGLSDKEDLIDPKTGKTIPNVLTGDQYTLKLHHQVDDKISVRSRDAYDRNLAPKGGLPHGGQALGALELYGLLAHNARSNIREAATYKAERNDELWSALQSGELLPPPRPTFAYQKFVTYLKGLGVNLEKDGNSLNLLPMTDKQILEMSKGEIKDGGRVVKPRTLEPERGGLFDPKVTGGHDGKNWAHLKLQEPMPNPLFEKAIMSVIGVRGPEFDRILKGSVGVTPKGEIVPIATKDAVHGPSAVASLLTKVNVDKELAKEEERVKGLRGQALNESNRRIKYLRALKRAKMTPTEAYMMTNVPVIPPIMRPISVLEDGSVEFEGLNQIYRHIALTNTKLKELHKGAPDEEKAPLRDELYDELKSLTGVGGTLRKTYPGILDIIAGKNPKCYDAQTEVLTKNGWLKFPEYNGVDEIGTVNLVTDQFEWQRPIKFHVTKVKGQLFQLKSRDLDLLVTPNHHLVVERFSFSGRTRIWKGVWEKVQVDSVNKSSRMRMMTAALDYVGADIDTTFLDSKVNADAFAEFVGWWLAEGWIGKPTKSSPGCVYLGQTKKPESERIDSCLRRLGIPFNRREYLKRMGSRKSWMTYWSINSATLAEWLIENCGRRSADRYLSPLILGWRSRYLRMLLSGYLSGDGHFIPPTNSGTSNRTWRRRSELAQRFNTISPRLIGDLQQLCLKIGLRVIERKPHPFRAGYRTCYRGSVVGFRDVTIGEKLIPRPKQYNGYVYGPTTRNGTVVVRRNGKPAVSGNSGFVQDKLIKRKQDLSMRSTIVPEPSLSLDEVGLPRKAAMELYKPFVVRELKSIAGMTPLQAQDAILKNSALANKALEKVVQERPVLLKRDPVLHRYGIQSFKPRLVDGKAILIHPLVTSGFNADFDGDQMAAFVPISKESVTEAFRMMPSNMLFNEASGRAAYTPFKEMQTGLFMLSEVGKRTAKKFKTKAELEAAVRKGSVGVNDAVSVGGVHTTYGRLQINDALPPVLQNGPILKDLNFRLTKVEQSKLFDAMAKESPKDYAVRIDTLKDLGNERAFATGFSIGLSDLQTLSSIRDPIVRSAQTKTKNLNLSKPTDLKKFVQVWGDAVQKLEAACKEKAKGGQTPLDKLEISAGTKGNAYRQLVGAPLLFQDAQGRIVPHAVTKNYSEGMDVAGYWSGVSGARKGAIEKVQSVAEPGYLSKLMMNSTMNLLIQGEDCGTSSGISLGTNEPDVIGRYLIASVKTSKGSLPAGTLITPEVLTKLRNDRISKIVVRSPTRCIHPKGVCQKCMGLAVNGKPFDQGTNIGVHAAQALGERGVQLSLRRFHSGGVYDPTSSSLVAADEGIERAKTLLNLPQIVRGSAVLSSANGKVTAMKKDPAGGVALKIAGKPHYIPADRTPLSDLKVGAVVKKGMPLTTGPINPHELLPLTNINTVQNHLVDELHKLYAPEGIKRRHSEVVVKALSNVTKVIDPGDHPDYIRGDFASTSEIQHLNRTQLKGMKPIRHNPILRGVKQIPLDVSEDWLARLNHEALKSTVIDAAQKGWKSNIHSEHPVPALIYGAEFGKGPEGRY